MSKRGPKDQGPKKPNVVRRAAGERKRLPADLEAFAGGDDDAIWRRPAKRRLHDPRPVVLVPGVANRDARAVYEARTRRARRAREAGDRDALAVELAEGARLAVWRGHSVVGWDVWVEEVLELSAAEAEELRRAGATSPAEGPADEDVIATWMRAEAGLLEVSPEGAVRLVDDTLRIEVPLAVAPAALAAMGRRAAPLARDHAEAPDSVIDRPKGVKPLSRVIERDMRGSDD